MGLLDKINFSSFFGLNDDDYDDYEDGVSTQEAPAMQKQAPVQQQPQQQSPSSQTQMRAMRSNPAPTSSQMQQRAPQTRTNYSQPRAYVAPTASSPTVNNTYARVERPKQERPRPTQTRKEEKVVSMNQGMQKSQKRPPSSQKIAIKEPRVYSEAMDIGRLLLAGEAVLINFHLMEESAARRVIDFLTGIVFASDGDIQRVGNEIFLCTPSNLIIDGDTARSLLHQHNFDF
ncbi:cell division inhibitor SepF [Pilibacter termitis]|uniref:Cell division protein SepF n=1 Tax=Pilibacter termitis TaxID=263852 RepID=A0A1T4M540_9ENTE|nr:cell division protein SepF [Pilibacter termitis]SJZ61898.1 cell division inhibitor SepF [Pilibacter termitis]